MARPVAWAAWVAWICNRRPSIRVLQRHYRFCNRKPRLARGFLFPGSAPIASCVVRAPRFNGDLVNRDPILVLIGQARSSPEWRAGGPNAASCLSGYDRDLQLSGARPGTTSSSPQGYPLRLDLGFRGLGTASRGFCPDRDAQGSGKIASLITHGHSKGLTVTGCWAKGRLFCRPASQQMRAVT